MIALHKRAGRFVGASSISFLALLLAASAVAQQVKPEDNFARAFFAPELVMQHARAISLTDDQRNAITLAIAETQVKAVSNQLRMLEQMQAVIEQVEQARINEGQVLPALNRVLDLEQEVKIAHTTLLIRIKNLLTPEQQSKLRELRDKREDPLR
jgi:Spy/CpxP family protein refolding chaperone